MPININIPAGGTYTSDATAKSSDILYGKTAYVDDVLVTGSIRTKSAETITPGRGSYTIKSGQYLDGDQTIKGDSNLSSQNIKSGVSIFGINGTLSPMEIKNASKILYAKARSNIDAGNFVIYDKTAFDVLSSPAKCNTSSVAAYNEYGCYVTKYGYVIGVAEAACESRAIWIYNVSTDKIAKVTPNETQTETINDNVILPIDETRALMFYYTNYSSYVMPILYNASSNTITIGTATRLGIGDRSIASIGLVGSYRNTYLIYLNMWHQFLVVLDFTSLTITIKKTTKLETTNMHAIGIALQYNKNDMKFGMIEGGYSSDPTMFYPDCRFSLDGTITFGSKSTWKSNANFNNDPAATWIDQGNGKGIVLTVNNVVHIIDLLNKTDKTPSANFSYQHLQLAATNDNVFAISSYKDWDAYQLVAYDISSGKVILNKTISTSMDFYSYGVFILNNKLYNATYGIVSEIR